MTKLVLASLLPALLAIPSRAQSINVDFEPTGSPFGLPSPTYVGSAGVPGVWNSVDSASVSNLLKWDGTPTGVSLSTASTLPGCGGAGLFFAPNDAGTSGENEALLDDRYKPDDGDVTWTFQGLAPGDYVVDTIILAYFSCMIGSLAVEVEGSPDPAQFVGGRWPGYFAQAPTSLPTDYERTYARHRKTVTDGTIRIRIVIAEKPHDYVFVSGIQLNMNDQGLIGTPLCAGDLSVGACPCGNRGSSGHGCQNSARTGGAILLASGTTSPDTVILDSSGELPSSFSIFLQGSAAVSPPANYGDGLRCAGGVLKRLYKKSASNGFVSAPGSGDLSVSARSASLGDPIPPGERRYYQVYYRDPNPSFCASPPGSTFNITNAVKLDW